MAFVQTSARRAVVLLAVAAVSCTAILGWAPKNASAAPPVACENGSAKLTGTFLEPTLFAGWDDARWTAELADMQALCMDTVVVRYTADTSIGTAWYPSTLPGMRTAFDLLGSVFRNAPTGMGVYVGLQIDDPGWFFRHADDPSYLWHQAHTATTLASDIRARFGSGPGWAAHFKGWYLPFELDNSSFAQAGAPAARPSCPTTVTTAPHSSWENLVGCFFGPVTESLRRTMTPGQRIITAPMFFIGSPYIQTPDRWSEMWTYLLANSGIDTLAPQDGVGAEHATTSDLAPWYQAAGTAVESVARSTGRAIQLWGTPESYLHNQSMPIRLLTDDMRAVQPFLTGSSGSRCGDAPSARCGTFIGFQYLHQSRSQAPLYFAAYQRYLSTGLTTTPPSAPGAISAQWADPVTMSLRWTPSSHPDGVAGYTVYRVTGTGTPTGADRVSTFFTPLSPANACGVNVCLTDPQLDPSTAYTYRVEAFDATGNVASSVATGSTPALAAPPGALGANLAAGRPYTASLAAHPSYPDSASGAKELTDGGYASSTEWTPPAWQGRATGDPYSITVDLGQVRTVGTVVGDWLQQHSAGIYLPAQIAHSVSSDGATWTDVATTPSPLVSNKATTSRYRAVNLSATGRFVRLTVTPFVNAWSFLDEIEVYAPAGPPVQANKALGRTYQVSTGASPSYPDAGRELTDGLFGTTNFTDTAWQGRKTAAAYSFTVDLGAARPLSSLTSDWLQVRSAGIYLPVRVTYSTSSDGSRFKTAGTVNRPTVTAADRPAEFTLSVNTTARWVRVVVQPTSSAPWWTFTDEIQVA